MEAAWQQSLRDDEEETARVRADHSDLLAAIAAIREGDGDDDDDDGEKADEVFSDLENNYEEDDAPAGEAMIATKGFDFTT